MSEELVLYIKDLATTHAKSLTPVDNVEPVDGLNQRLYDATTTLSRLITNMTLISAFTSADHPDYGQIADTLKNANELMANLVEDVDNPLMGDPRRNAARRIRQIRALFNL